MSNFSYWSFALQSSTGILLVALIAVLLITAMSLLALVLRRHQSHTASISPHDSQAHSHFDSPATDQHATTTETSGPGIHPTLARFLYPIVDSGYFFELTLLEVTKTLSPEQVVLTIKYSLTNTQHLPFQIPINISHRAHLNCRQERDFAHDPSPRIISRRVVNLQSNDVMYGYGDDHHVSFRPQETKEFLIVFEPAATDFATFDIEFFMQPPNEPYGLYRLRYDFETDEMIKRYCVRTYPR